MDRDEFELYKEDLRFNESALPGIVEEAHRLLELQEESEKLEQQLAAVNAQILKIRREFLPEKMKAAGLQTIKLPSGWTVDIKFKVMGSLIKGDKNPMQRVLALDTLKALGGNEIIKNTMHIVIDKGKGNLIPQVVEMLLSLGLNAEVKEDVNPMTLQAWARRQLDEVANVGDFIAESEKIGLFIGNDAKVKKEE